MTRYCDLAQTFSLKNVGATNYGVSRRDNTDDFNKHRLLEHKAHNIDVRVDENDAEKVRV